MSKKDLYPFSNLDFKIFDEVTTIIMPVLEQHEQTYRTLKGGLGMPSDNVEKAKDIVRTGYQEYLTSASAKAVEKIMGDEPTKTDALEKNNKFEKPAAIVSLEAKIDDLRQKNRRQKPTLF